MEVFPFVPDINTISFASLSSLIAKGYRPNKMRPGSVSPGFLNNRFRTNAEKREIEMVAFSR